MLNNVPEMKTIREVAATGILPEHALRQLVKEGKIAFITIGKSRVLVNFTALLEQLQKPESGGRHE